MQSDKCYQISICFHKNNVHCYQEVKNLLGKNSNFLWQENCLKKGDLMLFLSDSEAYAPHIKQKIDEIDCFLVTPCISEEETVEILDYITVAKMFNKPVIAFLPYGGARMNSKLKEAVDQIVSWNLQSIIPAIEDKCKQRQQKYRSIPYG